jgi:hypothetical protein
MVVRHPDVAAPVFTIVRSDTGVGVFHGDLSAADVWTPSRESARLADFSALSTTGT